MYTYIKRSVAGFYLELPEMLSQDLYDNIGETYEDFMQDKWVLLSDDQIAFGNEHPNATVKEVFEMSIEPEPVRTLDDAKQEMLRKIDMYDLSENVNGFSINGKVQAWFTPIERQGYKQSVDSAKILGVESLSFFINDNIYTISTSQAELMLAALQLYADACYIATKKHRLEVEKLDSIEAVDSYEYTTDYPEKLNFNLG